MTIAPDRAWRMGMGLGIAASSMMFVGLTSAYVVSQGFGPAWSQLHMRPILWINTGVLLLSSASMERTRRSPEVRNLLATLGLGLLFLAGQIAAFQQLGQEGYYLNTGRQSSFYYVLAGLHGLHVTGGILALIWIGIRMRRDQPDPRRQTRIEVVSYYWHFMGALWIYLLGVLFL